MERLTSIREGIRLFADRVFDFGGVIEIVKLKCGRHGTVRGYFDSLDAAVVAVEELGDDLNEDGTYITLNPLSPNLLARTNNSFEDRAATRAADVDVVYRLWLPIDIDPVRPTGISSTAEELQAAMDRRQAVVDWLKTDFGFPDPVLLMSGNGAHALFAIEEPNDEGTATLIKRHLAALDQTFSDDTVKIDTTVCNAARIWTLPGSIKRKGANMPDRPHRVANIDSRPEPLQLVTRAQLQAVVGAVTPKKRRPKALRSTRRSSGVLDMQAEFAERGWYERELTPGKHAVKCPWVEEHSGQSGITETVIYEPEEDGAVWGFKCQHSHCAERTIKDVWGLFRPDEEAPDPKDAADERVTISDFVYVAPEDKFLCLPTGGMWPRIGVDNRLRMRPKASDQIAQAATVEQMSWLPGKPPIVENLIVSDGGFTRREGFRIANQYRSPNRTSGDPDDIGLWLDHLARLYPDTFDHIIDWFAHRIQFPGEKVNHALVLGGKQGIGKDTILDPLKAGVGSSNFAEISPRDLMGSFTPHLKSVVLRISEARDTGDENRYHFYETSKVVITSPPDVLRVNEKNTKEYYVPNVTGVIFTTNHRDGLFIPEDDRRHHVSWANDVSKEDFDRAYWDRIYKWYDDGGRDNVITYLAMQRDLSQFDAKNPPPKTTAWREMVAIGMDPVESDLFELLDRLGRPQVLSIQDLKAGAGKEDIYKFLDDRKNRRRVPHLMEGAGYRAVRSTFAKDGLWVMGRKRVALYALETLSEGERLRAVRAYVDKAEAT